jgi:hypothetical protein
MQRSGLKVGAEVMGPLELVEGLGNLQLSYVILPFYFVS